MLFYDSSCFQLSFIYHNTVSYTHLHLQLARTIVRRAERRLWTLNRKDPVSPGIMRFVNRLSDLFFTMARYEMFRQGNAEERWQSFLYKRKK